jgi:GntR family transcriptional regulator
MNVARQNIKLDADSGTPLYMQMAAELATAIRKGAWSSGEALPSERVLADALGVSRITSRKAMALLAERGLIRRVQGVGTFIMPCTNALPLSLTGVTTLAQLDGFTACTRWLSRSIRAADFEEATHLDLPPLANSRIAACLLCARCSGSRRSMRPYLSRSTWASHPVPHWC